MSDRSNVFTYGSLMFPVVWQRVVRGDYGSAVATVHGFKRMRIQDGQHPALVIAPRAVPFAGRIYYDVSPVDIARLDFFETDKYARVTVATTVDGVAVSAQAYLALNFDLLLETEWSSTEFEQRGLPIFLSTYTVRHAPPD